MDSYKPESTFRSFNTEQAKRYAASRTTYQLRLFNLIFSHHRSTGGKFELVIDVGCGTGQATNELAQHFNNVWGLDQSPAMINTAKDMSIAWRTKTGKPINWKLGTGEELDKLIEQGVLREHTVDMVTVATAVHWFDLSKFYPQCARLLRPGGTIALWTYSPAIPHPSTANHAEIQRVLHDFHHRLTGPHIEVGNRIARDLYKNLLLPWQIDPDQVAFPEAEFVRKEWDRGGVLSATEPADGSTDIDFFSGSKVFTLEQWGKGIGTSSPVTRWRQANPELDGTERDCVVELLKALREAGAGEEIRLGAATVLLMFKRR